MDLLVVRPLGGADREVTGLYIGPGPDGRPLEEVTSAAVPAARSGAATWAAIRPAGFCAMPPASTRARRPARSAASAASPSSRGRTSSSRSSWRCGSIRSASSSPTTWVSARPSRHSSSRRELLDRGEIQRLAVLCPPHLAEQWQRALAGQFHLGAELVLASTAARLERTLGVGREPVLALPGHRGVHRLHQAGPPAPHASCAPAPSSSSWTRPTAAPTPGRDARGRCATGCCASSWPTTRAGTSSWSPPRRTPARPTRSARSWACSTPSSRICPRTWPATQHRRDRERVARHLVQRRRGDLTSYMDANTPFPRRDVAEDTYELAKPYRAFLDRVVAFCRESVLDGALDERRQRIRWWSALALLRALSSSPAAAAATLRNRAGNAELEELDAIDEEGRRAVLDLDEESTEGLDVAPGAGTEVEESPRSERLRKLARDAEALAGKGDTKLRRAVALVEKLVADGFSPILFCRFIPTVEYVADALRQKLKDVAVEAVTGSLAAEGPRGPSGRARPRAPPCSRLHRLPVRGHQPAGLLQRRHSTTTWPGTRPATSSEKAASIATASRGRSSARSPSTARTTPWTESSSTFSFASTAPSSRRSASPIPVPSDAVLVGKAIMEGLILRTDRTPTQLKLGEELAGFAPEIAMEVDPGLEGSRGAREEEPHAVRPAPAAQADRGRAFRRAGRPAPRARR